MQPPSETSYLRVGLKYNPFFFLSSEAIQTSLPIEIEKIHVSSDIDTKIASALRDSIVNKKRKLIFLTGVFGLGKTERAKLIKKILEEKGFIAVYIKIDTSNPKTLVHVILRELINKHQEIYSIPFLGKLKKSELHNEISVSNLVTNPEKTLLKVKKIINELSPFALICDELENVFHAHVDEQKFFFSFLLSLYKMMPTNSLLVVACIPAALNLLKSLKNDFYQEINEVIHLTPLKGNESLKLVEKRIQLARDKNFNMENPLYPFTQEAILYANEVAKGNARYLLKILRTALATLIADPNKEIVDKKFIEKVVKNLRYEKAIKKEAKKKIKEEVIPQEYLNELKVIINEFEGGPVNYIQLAKINKIPAVLQLRKLKEMEKKGLVMEEAGRFYIKEEIKRRIQK